MVTMVTTSLILKQTLVEQLLCEEYNRRAIGVHYLFTMQPIKLKEISTNTMSHNWAEDREKSALKTENLALHEPYHN